jgi:hypothetical protein
MHARVVRFTDVSQERIDEILKRVEESDGPPEGVPSIGFRLYHDEDQGTALFIALFEDEEKLKQGNEALDQMDAEQTPGTRASVDVCELKVERDAEPPS